MAILRLIMDVSVQQKMADAGKAHQVCAFGFALYDDLEPQLCLNARAARCRVHADAPGGQPETLTS